MKAFEQGSCRRRLHPGEPFVPRVLDTFKAWETVALALPGTGRERPDPEARPPLGSSGAYRRRGPRLTAPGRG